MRIDSKGTSSTLVPHVNLLNDIETYFNKPLTSLISDYIKGHQSITDILPRLLYINALELIELSTYLNDQFKNLEEQSGIAILVDASKLNEREQFIYRQFYPGIDPLYRSAMQKNCHDEAYYLGQVEKRKGNWDAALEFFNNAGLLGKSELETHRQILNASNTGHAAISYREAYDLLLNGAKQFDLFSLQDIAMLYLGKLDKLRDNSSQSRLINYDVSYHHDKDNAIKILQYIIQRESIHFSQLVEHSCKIQADELLSNPLHQKDHNIDIVMQNLYRADKLFDSMYLNSDLHSSLEELLERYPSLDRYLLASTMNISETLRDELKTYFQAVSEHDAERLKSSYYCHSSKLIFRNLKSSINNLATICGLDTLNLTRSIYINTTLGRNTVSKALLTHSTFSSDFHSNLAYLKDLLTQGFALDLISTNSLDQLIRNLSNINIIKDDIQGYHHIFMIVVHYEGLINQALKTKIFSHYRQLSENKTIDEMAELCEEEDIKYTATIISNWDDKHRHILGYKLYTLLNGLHQGSNSRPPLPAEIIEQLFSKSVGSNIANCFIKGDILTEDTRKERRAHLELLMFQKASKRPTDFRLSCLHNGINNALSFANNQHCTFYQARHHHACEQTAKVIKKSH